MCRSVCVCVCERERERERETGWRGERHKRYGDGDKLDIMSNPRACKNAQYPECRLRSGSILATIGVESQLMGWEYLANGRDESLLRVERGGNDTEDVSFVRGNSIVHVHLSWK